jgi:hypothetical protein
MRAPPFRVAALGCGFAILATALCLAAPWPTVAGTTVLAVLGGYVLGSRGVGSSPATRELLFHVADELANYRAFTRLMRDQGERIAETGASGGALIVGAVTAMDRGLIQLAVEIERGGGDLDRSEIAARLRAATGPASDVWRALHHQDMTRQQIAFLNRLSLILDDHLANLSGQLGDRRGLDRCGRFAESVDKALAGDKREA